MRRSELVAMVVGASCGMHVANGSESDSSNSGYDSDFDEDAFFDDCFI